MFTSRFCYTIAAIALVQGASAQNNSPYSRYGLGDVVPSTHIINRGMGGVAVADTDLLHVNFINPASYASFYAVKDPGTGKLAFGRVLLDAGLNLENRTLREPNKAGKFTSSDLYFQYIQFGIPLAKRWGMAFGIRQMNRVRYQMEQRSRVAGIDSLLTEYTGDGGVYLPSIGTGVSLGKLNLGVNVGYMFGNRQASTASGLVNDTVGYVDALYKTETSFGNLYADAGLQYKINLNKNGSRYLHLGASGNLKQKLQASRDITQGSFVGDPTNPLSDTVKITRDVKGTIIYPASYKVGFIVGGYGEKTSTWQFGVDYVHTAWSDFRSFGQKDAVGDDWQLRAGGMLRPGRGLLNYRAGFYTGQDYINVSGNMPVWGASVGVGIPIINYNPVVRDQFTVVNVTLEYNSRGNNSNLLKENMFRLSAGFSLSDFWFKKRKYD